MSGVDHGGAEIPSLARTTAVLTKSENSTPEIDGRHFIRRWRHGLYERFALLILPEFGLLPTSVRHSFKQNNFEISWHAVAMETVVVEVDRKSNCGWVKNLTDYFVELV